MSSHDEPIFIDEEAEAIALVIVMISRYRQVRWDDEDTWSLLTREAALRICYKFDIEEARREVEEMIKTALRDDPYEGFVWASQENNIALGKRAIKLMELQDSYSNLWNAISRAKSSWQVALVQLVAPDPAYYAKVYSGHTPAVEPPLTMNELAERFQPL